MVIACFVTVSILVCGLLTLAVGIGICRFSDTHLMNVGSDKRMLAEFMSLFAAILLVNGWAVFLLGRAFRMW